MANKTFLHHALMVVCACGVPRCAYAIPICQEYGRYDVETADKHDFLSQDSVLTLEEVVVSGVREVTPNQQLSLKQISALPSNNVADALKYMAGVQIKDYGGLGGQKTVNVRSLGSQHVGVYMDGVRITNAQNGTVDLGKYSLTTLESVSLYNANKTEMLMMASEYASASTIYLRTRRPDSTQVVASYQAASFGTHKVAATYFYKQLAFIDASFTHSDGDYPFEYHTQYEDTTGTRQGSDITMLRVEGAAFHKYWQWHGYYYMSERGLPGGVVRRLSNRYTDVGREWDKNFFTQLTYNNSNLLNGVGIRAMVKYSNDYLHYRSDYPENISVHSNNRYHQQDLYGAMAGSYKYKDVGVSLSSDLRWSDLTTLAKRSQYVYRMDSKTSVSAFYNARGWNLNVGGLYTYVQDHTALSAEPLEQITWNALTSYTHGRWLWRAFYKSVFRVPTLNDLYYTLVGNRRLKPEYTKQFDVGVAYNGTLAGCVLNIQADVYHNRIEDRIVCLPLKGSYQWTMLNYGRTRSLGVDVSMNAKYRNHTLMMTGTFQDDRDRTNPQSDAYNDFIAYSPQWTLTAVYTFDSKLWGASLSHMFVDKRYWTAENSIEQPLSAYHSTDIKIMRRLGRMVTIEAECQDVFDVRYEMIQRWPMPGRRYSLTFKYTM